MVRVWVLAGWLVPVVPGEVLLVRLAQRPVHTVVWVGRGRLRRIELRLALWRLRPGLLLTLVMVHWRQVGL